LILLNDVSFKSRHGGGVGEVRHSDEDDEVDRPGILKDDSDDVDGDNDRNVILKLSVSELTPPPNFAEYKTGLALLAKKSLLLFIRFSFIFHRSSFFPDILCVLFDTILFTFFFSSARILSERIFTPCFNLIVFSDLSIYI
jgi:hypothetical protein